MRYLILVVFFVFSCKSTSKSNSSQIGVVSDDFEEIERVLSKETVNVKVKNISGKDIFILDPLKKVIERRNGDLWESVSVLYCDCGGPPCPAPPNERSIENGGLFSFSWDLLVEECKSEGSSRTTVKTKATKGDYRVIYRTRANGSRESQDLVIQFSL